MSDELEHARTRIKALENEVSWLRERLHNLTNGKPESDEVVGLTDEERRMPRLDAIIHIRNRIGLSLAQSMRYYDSEKAK